MKKSLTLISCVLMTLLAGIRAMAYTTSESETLTVWYEVPTFVADGKTVNYIKVYEKDGDNAYSAFNMHFVLPEGFRVNQIKQGREMVNDIVLSERGSSTHSISCNMPNATTLKIICTSSANDNLYTTDLDGQPLDLLFTVGLIADADMLPGIYDLYLDGIKFVFKTGDACVPANEPIYDKMVVSETSAIEKVDSERLSIDDCYDLQGRKVDPTREHGTVVITRDGKFLLR